VLSPALLAALALALACVSAAPAPASSVVYIDGGNVWLANPDGSGQYQVTLDGTPGSPYTSPSESAEGMIEAQRGGTLYRMSQNGTQLSAPFTTAANGEPLDPVLSPDGSKVSFWSPIGVDPCYPWTCLDVRTSYQVSYADHWVSPGTFNPNWESWSSFSNAAWLSSSRQLIFTHAGDLWYYDLGRQEPVQWVFWHEVWEPGPESGGFWYEGALSPDGSRLALLGLSENAKRFELQIYATAGDLATGNPPAAPKARCVIVSPDPSNPVGSTNGEYTGYSLFDSLSWSPDSDSLAFEYRGEIYVATITSLAECEQGTLTKVLTGTDPSFSPANVNPAPRPQPQPGGVGTAGTAGSGAGATTQTGSHAPQPACAGLAGLALRQCNARQSYHRALADCARRHHGSSGHERALAAACRHRAATAYHRALALAVCAQKHDHGTRARCERAARRVR
jgi:hypothetical protein